MNRRSFLRSFGALAAAAVAGPTLAKLAPTDVDRLVSAMRSGLIEGQTFRFSGPITLDVDNLMVRRCTFLFECPTHMRSAIILKGDGLWMTDCTIDCGKHGADYAIEISERVENVGVMGTRFSV
jgi:hypothetical protein